MSSFWIDSSKNIEKDYPSLKENNEVDVCIVGGGLVGITSAYFLSNTNLKICILECDKICNHVSRSFYCQNNKPTQSFL